jgi:hypothetical protein
MAFDILGGLKAVAEAAGKAVARVAEAVSGAVSSAVKAAQTFLHGSETTQTTTREYTVPNSKGGGHLDI